jgi:hypothetical protein
VETGATAGLVRHRQTKEAATDRLDLTPTAPHSDSTRPRARDDFAHTVSTAKPRRMKAALIGVGFWIVLFGPVGAAEVGLPSQSKLSLSAQAQAFIAPVHDAYVRVDAQQKGRPRALTDKDRLERLLEIDQAGRTVLEKLDFATLPRSEGASAKAAVWAEISTHDQANQIALKAMMPREGWFLKSKVGEQGSLAAFFIVQHATNDPALMRMALARMEPMIASGEADGRYWALLYDRVALELDSKPQRFGSQVKCRNGAWTPDNLEDPDHVDNRRTAVGFKSTETEYLKNFSDVPCR